LYFKSLRKEVNMLAIYIVCPRCLRLLEIERDILFPEATTICPYCETEFQIKYNFAAIAVK